MKDDDVQLTVRASRHVLEALAELAELAGTTRQEALQSIVDSVPDFVAQARKASMPMTTRAGLREIVANQLERLDGADNLERYGTLVPRKRGTS